MKANWNDSHLKKHFERKLQDALRGNNGFVDSDFDTLFLDGIKTKSPRIWKMIALAYHRGILKGIEGADDGKNIITLR